MLYNFLYIFYNNINIVIYFLWAKLPSLSIKVDLSQVSSNKTRVIPATTIEYIYIKKWSTTQTMKIDNIYKKYRETWRYTQWSHFKFTTFSFKSFFAAITGSCLLIACQIETVNWTVKMAKLSIVRLLALDTHPSDRITRPTLLWTFCTAWSEVIWRTYCNQKDCI